VSELDGRVAIIVGAGPGIGRASAERLAGEGADLCLVARRAGPLEALAENLRKTTGRRVLAVPADLGRVADCEALVEQTVSELGRVDIVVNVATYSAGSMAVVDSEWEVWRNSFEINVVGTLEVSRSAARHMKREGGGSIVQIATLGMHSLVPKRAAYNATKQAMVTASRTLAREMGRDGIRVNIVTPGFTTGEPLDQLFADIGEKIGTDGPTAMKRAAQTAALKSHVDPEDIAEAVYFLASPRSRFVTGVEIIVDAGQHIGG
jgi:NAD(P)-dependent dehydrogenase (short-subunit alcohol dehydrogenase family)